MPTTIRYLGHPAEAHSETSNVFRDRNAKIGDFALLMAWAVIMLIVAVAAPSSPEATTMDPFQLLATF
jgi:hypothetical protein